MKRCVPEQTTSLPSPTLTIRVDAYIREHDVSCEWTPRRTHDCCLTEEFADFEAKALDGIRKAGGKQVVDVTKGEEAVKVCATPCFIPACLIVYLSPCAMLMPSRLLFHINQATPSHSLADIRSPASPPSMPPTPGTQQPSTPPNSLSPSIKKTSPSEATTSTPGPRSIASARVARARAAGSGRLRPTGGKCMPTRWSLRQMPIARLSSLK